MSIIFIFNDYFVLEKPLVLIYVTFSEYCFKNTGIAQRLTHVNISHCFKQEKIILFV